MKLKLAIVVGLMLLWTNSVRAQSLSKEVLNDVTSKMISNAVDAVMKLPSPQGACQPSNQPTFTVPKPKAVAPSQVPFAAVTMNMTDGNGNNPSHKVTVGTNTLIVINVQGYNAATIALYYTVNSGSQQTWIPPQTTLTAQVGFISYPSWVGSTFHLKAVATEKSGSGSFSTTTQDVGSITVTSQAQGFYYQDGNDSNVYYLMSHTYSGTPQIDFNTCQQAAEKPGIPTATMQIYNASSGESRNGVTFQGSTGVIDDQNLLSATAYDYVSALPGDTINVSYGGKMFCSAIGDFWKVDQVFRIEGAVVVVKDLGHPPRMGPDGVSIYDIAPICQNNCDPPDWQPQVVYSWVGRQPYWVGECQLLRAPDIAGFPWIPLCDVMNDASKAFGSGLIPTTIQLATGGLSLPYPGPAPDLPIPGKCTKYPVNVLFTVGPKDLLNFFKNLFN